jgi:hypothetical protein
MIQQPIVFLMRCARRCVPLVVAIVATSCGGLEPTNTATLPTQVYGTIAIEGGATTWPPADSLIEVRVVMFQDAPTKPDDVFGMVAGGTAIFTDALMPMFSDSLSYLLPINNAPRTFRYVVVAGRVGDNFLTDWIMLAVATEQSGVPRVLTINPQNSMEQNFRVNFLNLPPQPF